MGNNFGNSLNHPTEPWGLRDENGCDSLPCKQYRMHHPERVFTLTGEEYTYGFKDDIYASDIRFGVDHDHSHHLSDSTFRAGQVTNDYYGRWNDGSGDGGNFFETRTKFTPSEIRLIQTIDPESGQMDWRNPETGNPNCGEDTRGVQANLQCLDRYNMQHLDDLHIEDRGASTEAWFGASVNGSGPTPLKIKADTVGCRSTCMSGMCVCWCCGD